MKQRQSGFTLVEIAIVLVIIGLLLGGIIQGQQLINSARVKNLAETNSGVQAAYFGFIDRYRQIPGDMDNTTANNAIGVTIAGGGNGNGSVSMSDANAGVTQDEAGSTPEAVWSDDYINHIFPWADEDDRILQFKEYHTYETVKERMQRLAEDHPDIFEFHEGMNGGTNARG